MATGGSVSEGSGGTTSPPDETGGAAGGENPPISLPESCSGVCNAATPAAPVVEGDEAQGNVTMYSTSPSSGGACLYGETSIRYYAAINVSLSAGDGEGQWQEGSVCGQCVAVAALTTQGPQQLVVRITDKCPDEHCGIDLGGDAPAAIMLDGYGRYEGAWRFVSCEGHPEVSDGPPSLFVKDGSNPYWAAVQVRNPVMAVTAIDWSLSTDASVHGELATASPSIENYYEVPLDILQGDDTFVLTVHYRDDSTSSVVLTSAELAQAESSYPLE